MATPTSPKPSESGQGGPPAPDQSPAEHPAPDPAGRKTDRHGHWPPDSLPNPMPGLDPQQTPGIDRLAGTPLADAVRIRAGQGWRRTLSRRTYEQA
ncbi:hypothetical protein [Achromobacter sp. RTa]|uniref:hypothetical protein n=1 Tax=Achromobacter sp. RTa TaxID=1532557 RepID=UPI000ADB70EC|nr:hypothetical protein [Achromobacter sp. RTa]